MTSEADAFTVSPSRLSCHAVLTSAPALLPFSIASSSAVPLRVTLGSTFGDAVRFQAHDPALAHPPLGAGEGGGPLPGGGGGGGDSPALLHEMNLISSVTLPPRGVVAVVLVFRPAVALTAAEDDQRRQAAAEVGAEEGGAGQSGRERAEAEARGTGSIRELSGAVLLAAHPVHAAAASRSAAPSSAPQFEARLPLSVRACRSLLRCEERELPFSNCVLRLTPAPTRALGARRGSCTSPTACSARRRTRTSPCGTAPRRRRSLRPRPANWQWRSSN